MNKTELIKTISSNTGVSKNDTTKIVNSFLRIVSKSLKEENRISLHSFGSFKKVIKGERLFYNPRTKHTELLPSRTHIKFAPFKELKTLFSAGKGKITTKPNTSLSYVSSKSKNNRIITKGSINLGSRRTGDTSEFHNNKFEYFGTVSYDCFLGENEHTVFPSVKTPQKGTKILKWYKSNNEAIVGVSEPLLVAEIEKLCKKFEGLTLLENIALPIQNREYSYRPDIALYWEQYDILLDIEIDEPYDICSRKPIHYIGCADNLRDTYFTRNGWCVIRYSESQVINNLNELIVHLEFVLNWLSGESGEGYAQLETKRWTYDEALEIAKSAQREYDLGIEKHSGNSTNEEMRTKYFHDNFIKPATDILPETIEISHYSLIDSQLDYALASSADYVRITDIYGREWILKKDTVSKKIKDDDTYVVGENLIISFYPDHGYKNIQKVEAVNSFYTEDKWSLEESISNKSILIKAATHGSPISIKYCNSYGEESQRTLCNIGLYLSSTRKDAPMMDLGTIANPDKNWRMYLLGFCSIRNEFRTFSSDSRLSEVKIINCRNSFIYPEVYQSSLAELIMNPYIYRNDFFSRVDYLVKNMPSKEKETLLSKGNLAHYTVIKGDLDKALKSYLSTPFDYDMKISSDQVNLWGPTCIEDINMFINESRKLEDSYYDLDILPSKMVENFERIKSMLIEHGWKWEV